jgi:hypothetical protein
VPSPAPDETLNVYWNGELLDNVRPETIDAYETFEFDIVAGSGDGTNTLRFEGVTDGTRDFQGVVIDDVRITAVAAEEDGGQDVISGGRGDDEIFGGAATPRLREARAQNWTQEPRIQGSYSMAYDYALKDSIAEIFAPLGGRVHFAGEALGGDAQSTVHGAALSARALAAQLV